jgi:hypothetical protein
MLAQKIRTTDIILTCNFEKINHSFLALNWMYWVGTACTTQRTKCNNTWFTFATWHYDTLRKPHQTHAASDQGLKVSCAIKRTRLHSLLLSH